MPPSPAHARAATTPASRRARTHSDLPHPRFDFDGLPLPDCDAAPVEDDECDSPAVRVHMDGDAGAAPAPAANSGVAEPANHSSNDFQSLSDDALMQRVVAARS